ncbi:MAG: hypothetical protein HY080_10165 [Gammaproteobacteria bacterium]|nr:hypothetical protein [Gammaproteobacteria bacterium]
MHNGRYMSNGGVYSFLGYSLLAVLLLSCATNPRDVARQRIETWASRVHATIYYEPEYFAVGVERTSPTPITELFLSWTTIDDEDLRELAEIGPVVYSIDLPSKMTDSLPHEILRDRSSKMVTDRGIEYLAKLKELRYLGMYDSAITDVGLASLKSLSNLKGLELSHTRIDGTGFAPLSDNKVPLEELAARNTKLTDKTGVVLAKFPKLRVLQLNETQIGDESVRAFGNLTKLEQLSLDGTRVTDASIPALVGLKNLKILSLGHTRLTDASIPALEKMTWVEIIGAGETHISPQGIKRLDRSRPSVNNNSPQAH